MRLNKRNFEDLLSDEMVRVLRDEISHGYTCGQGSEERTPFELSLQNFMAKLTLQRERNMVEVIPKATVSIAAISPDADAVADPPLVAVRVDHPYTQ